MDNPKKQDILSTQDTERRQTNNKDTTQKIKMMNNTDPHRT